jgi:hypothetical protein
MPISQINSNSLQSGQTLSVNGITFPATQSASANANTLDDYEEGTWTPTYAAQSGTLTTVTTSQATYTKIGRQVTASIRLTITNVGTASGALYFSVPFTSASGSIGVGREQNVTGVILQGILDSGAGLLAVLDYANNPQTATGRGVSMTITYFV